MYVLGSDVRSSGSRMDPWRLVPALAGAGACILAVGGVLGPRLEAIEQAWTRGGPYSYGFLVAPTSAFLAWKLRKRAARAEKAPTVSGLLTVSCALALTLFLDATGVALTSLTPLLLITILAGTAASLYGWQVVRILAFPFLFLIFLMPIPMPMIMAIDYPLQEFCARFTTHAAWVFGISAVREGATVHLPNFTMTVASACNGLRSAFALVALATLIAYLRKGPTPGKVLMVGLAIPLAYLANFFRLLCDVIVVNALGSRFRFYEHTWDLTWGFLTFLIATVVLLQFAKTLRCAEYRSIS